MLAVRTAGHRRAGGNGHWQAAHCYGHQAGYRHPIPCRRRHAIGFRFRRLRPEGIRRQVQKMHGVLPRILNIAGQCRSQAMPQAAGPSTAVQSIAMPQPQMLRSAKRTFATRRDGNTTLALANGDLLRDLGGERTHGKTPGAARIGRKKKSNKLQIDQLTLSSRPGRVNPGQTHTKNALPSGKWQITPPLDHIRHPTHWKGSPAAWLFFYFSTYVGSSLPAGIPRQYRPDHGCFTNGGRFCAIPNLFRAFP